LTLLLFYKEVPGFIREKVLQILDGRLREVLEEFEMHYIFSLSDI
jgi:hypothetical protein